jgi:wyosine [tRNA(Phe)-imidazoG37] synthetase (radical SAM superfamily)
VKYKYLFGPVASRRLGLSLGVDIIPAKICNLDCIYCECGPTLTKTNERKEYAKPSAVIAELGNFLSASPSLDFVTITGSGEPTLNTGIGPIISFLKDEFPSYKTALLTNGTLLSDPDVRAAAMRFDYVLPSLDAVSRGVFASVNRPHPDLESGAMVRGLADFSRSYKGVLWLEVFLVPGVNDSAEELSLLKKAGHAVRPSRVQLNTLDRPGTVASVKPVPGKRLTEIADFLRPLPVEIISCRFKGQTGGPAAKELEPGILALLRRRPSTIEDLAVASRRSINELGPLLSRLEKDKAVTTETVNNRMFYKSNKSVASSTRKTG